MIMTTTTYGAVAARTGTRVPDHLLAQAEVPTAHRGARQGDVVIVRADHLAPAPAHPARPLTGRGHQVVRGDADRNSHVLNGDGTFHEGRYTDDLDYGLLVVPAGGEAVLTHSGEHGSIAFGEGTYRVLGQLDHQAQRRVVD